MYLRVTKGDYYLVYYNDECPFWANKAQVPADIIEKYEKKQNKPVSFSKNQKNYIEVCKNKDKTDGVFLGCYNCNIIASFKEINRNESCTQAAIFSLDSFDMMINSPDILVYDLGSRLRKLINNSEKILKVTDRLVKLRNKTIVEDRFHYLKHTEADDYCVNYCNPDEYEELTKKNTSVCEQINFWLFG
ncbi:unnamed protein product [Brachionus calyciflorus]|uniref:Uncharacterized protein n=1 Tax=Brachionus calyciflorus TaxID=104777 RepID=A0A814RR25_9BILA|nr:unnamed protein product [Brachionus calyciflorus]